jgi:hypothetical protein
MINLFSLKSLFNLLIFLNFSSSFLLNFQGAV